MIDLHCHILPGIDDGADSLQTALDMARIALDNGITAAAATSHLGYPSELWAFCRRRDQRLERLREALAKAGLPLELYPGAEIYVDDDLFFAPRLTPAALNGSRFLLVEFTFGVLTYTQLRRYLAELREREARPIIAHPERLLCFRRNPSWINELREEGILFQINAASLAGYGNRDEHRLAAQMAVSQVADFLATDAHDPVRRPPNFAALRRRFPAALDEDQIRYMTETAPAAVLADELPPKRAWDELIW
ncbi:MAG: hypothetical protein LBJ11_04770 [Oscillospiraceae bacterium]|nr:hypothetical protein [Oscillospiraceae bacterium]